MYLKKWVNPFWNCDIISNCSSLESVFPNDSNQLLLTHNCCSFSTRLGNPATVAPPLLWQLQPHTISCQHDLHLVPYLAQIGIWGWVPKPGYFSWFSKFCGLIHLAPLLQFIWFGPLKKKTIRSCSCVCWVLFCFRNPSSWKWPEMSIYHNRC
jgi:hypothetical protein